MKVHNHKTRHFYGASLNPILFNAHIVHLTIFLWSGLFKFFFFCICHTYNILAYGFWGWFFLLPTWSFYFSCYCCCCCRHYHRYDNQKRYTNMFWNWQSKLLFAIYCDMNEVIWSKINSTCNGHWEVNDLTCLYDPSPAATRRREDLIAEIAFEVVLGSQDIKINQKHTWTISIPDLLSILSVGVQQSNGD